MIQPLYSNHLWPSLSIKLHQTQYSRLFSLFFPSHHSADDLNNAISACGQDAGLLQIGQEICLPGSEKPGCPNVKSYNNNENCKVYVVQQGDTVNSVADSLGIYNQELQNLNADVVSAGILQPNKYLKLPTWSQTCGDPNKAGESCRVYIVSTGDFVAGIASAFGVSTDDILAVNPGLSAGAVLQNGQPIKIPPFPASCGAGTPTKPPTDTVIKCRGYRVSTGDNLQSIAQAFKTTVAELGNVNPELAGGALVQPGTIVKIPPYDSSCDQPILVKLPSSNGASPSPANASPAVPVPLPLFSPSPVVASPSPAIMPSPMVPSPMPAPVPAPMEAPVPAPSSEAPAPAPEVTPVVVTAPPPISAAISPKAAMAAVFAVIAALAF